MEHARINFARLARQSLEIMRCKSHMVGRFTRRAAGRDDMEVESDIADETALFEVRLRARVREWGGTRL